MPLSSYVWPRSPLTGMQPIWNGKAFRVGDEETAVLSYTSTNSNWSDELTLIHETDAGNGDHPIDRASRTLAMRTVKRALPAQRGLVLDVGCSSGFFLRDLRVSMPGIDAIGADYIISP